MNILGRRSQQLDRKILGPNGAEAQGVYEAEDKGWKYQLPRSMIHGKAVG